MKKKFIWLIVSCLMVAALVLASCAPKVVEEKKATVVTKEPEKKVEEVVEPAVGEPQYGGKITCLQRAIPDPTSPDIADGFFEPTQWLSPIQERPFVGDFEKYGPRGTGEYTFQLNSYVPEKYIKGCLIESWEISPEKTVWHVRPEVYWQGRDVMESRELVADDVVADLLYYRDAPAGKRFKAHTDNIYAEDKYTVVIETHCADVLIMYLVGYEDRSLISPPETEGSDRWEDQVGTGPWMFEDYVPGSHMSYVKNPLWWKTTTINGKEYSLPFIDRMVWPIIIDDATRVAALRTGKVDFHHKVSPGQWKPLDKTCPELLSSHDSAGYGAQIGFKCTEPPFDNVEVRRAMLIGTNMKAFADLQGVGPLPLHWWPVYHLDPTVYTPLEELPEDIQVLYDYNPEKAKQMLADAGYPSGLKTNYYCRNTETSLDMADLLEYMWAKIGVEVTIVPMDIPTYEVNRRKQTYTGCIENDTCVSNPVDAIGRLHGGLGGGPDTNVTGWWNSRYEELFFKTVVEIDITERANMIREASLIGLREVPYVPTNVKVRGHYWWPWIKNYYGERVVGDNDFWTVLAHAWIDQDLKKEMGY